MILESCVYSESSGISKILPYKYKKCLKSFHISLLLNVIKKSCPTKSLTSTAHVCSELNMSYLKSW